MESDRINSISVITVPAMGDNYIYLCRYEQDKVFAVDPCDAPAVQSILKENALKLTTILITHHHWDHTAGVEDLKKKTGCIVRGPDSKRITGIDKVVTDGQILTVGEVKIQVIATPGHTSTSVCYYVPSAEKQKKGILFTGDTLFVNGCGRIFECGAMTMLDSLLKLASLPDETLIYCGHNYAAENCEFALSIEPDNAAVKERLQQIKQLQAKGKPTVPSTILQEKAANPFLRADTAEIKAALNMPGAKRVDVFAQLRQRKDVF